MPGLLPPVDGPVVAGFTADGRFGPGHRGLDLAARPGTTVRSAVAGRVTFAGTVAGQRWVTVAPHDRVLVTVGPLDEVAVARGDLVRAGTRLGTSAGAHGTPAVHLSLRVDGVHVDPAPHLRARPPRASLVGDGPPGRASVSPPAPSRDVAGSGARVPRGACGDATP